MLVVADALALLAVVAFLIVPSVICWLKGKKLWAVFGFITLWHWIPVFRLAKPDSWWATRYYDEEKLVRSRGRFAGPRSLGAAAPSVLVVEDFTAQDIALQDKVTRKAWEKAQKQKHRR
jgi:hypothetical protein